MASRFVAPIAAALALFAAPAIAQSVAEPRAIAFNPGEDGIAITAPLGGAPDATPLSILREIYPDLRADGTGESIVAVRELSDGMQPTIEPGAHAIRLTDYDMSGYGGPVSVAAIGQNAFVLSGGILAVAQLAPGYRFTDAAFVQSDPGGLPGLEKAFDAPAGPAALIANRHHNSQEGFEVYDIIGVVDGRLAALHDGLFLYSLSAPEGDCGWQVIRQRLDAFTPRFRRGRADRIDMTVVETRQCDTETGSVTLGERRFAIRLTWDARTRRYAGGSLALDALNRQRRGE